MNISGIYVTCLENYHYLKPKRDEVSQNTGMLSIILRRWKFQYWQSGILSKKEPESPFIPVCLLCIYLNLCPVQGHCSKHSRHPCIYIYFFFLPWFLRFFFKYFLVSCLWTQYWKYTSEAAAKQSIKPTASMSDKQADKNVTLRIHAKQPLGHALFGLFHVQNCQYLVCHTQSHCKLDHTGRIWHPS